MVKTKRASRPLMMESAEEGFDIDLFFYFYVFLFLFVFHPAA
jgi:hypothetical protein